MSELVEDLSELVEPSREEMLAAQEEEINQFQQRVSNLLQMVKDDPEVRDRMLAEMYIYFTDMERHMRTMAINGGPIKMLKAMMGRG